MSMATLERAIVAEAREVLCNSKFKTKELLEWSTSESQVRSGAEANDVVLFLPRYAVWIAVAKTNDKRVQAPEKTT